MIDLKNEITEESLSASDEQTSSITGSALDLNDYFGKLKIVQDVGTVSGTSPTLDGKIQDSEDGSTGWSDVAGATFQQVTSGPNLQSISIDRRATKRYIRYVGTIGGATPSFNLGVLALAQKQIK